jgi:hypothetical protein
MGILCRLRSVPAVGPPEPGRLDRVSYLCEACQRPAVLWNATALLARFLAADAGRLGPSGHRLMSSTSPAGDNRSWRYQWGVFEGSLLTNSGHRSSISSRMGSEMVSMRSKSRTSLWMCSISAEWMIRPSKGSATAASKHECFRFYETDVRATGTASGQSSAAVH